jgi:hypothetical protein
MSDVAQFSSSLISIISHPKLRRRSLFLRLQSRKAHPFFAAAFNLKYARRLPRVEEAIHASLCSK